MGFVEVGIRKAGKQEGRLWIWRVLGLRLRLRLRSGVWCLVSGVWCLVSGGLVGFVEVGIRNAGMQEGRLWEGVINFV
jgi:hypothetical protein